ncbi:type VI secretion protein [Polymorphobacter multimanifer]|uniref:Type IV secretion system protein VirB6 n=1 Tax=Polymorphobacter multimanifer TaxID=1070431 RepID=A0A841L8A2_9SPHN|nr:type IV secretion system protein [Polymorphobacter multimanifer]MBB6229249.1 type IV secretion system protein VirB6 [Polymorphobacter multimanifer]GGI85123.1 type VI secretion protein [Polymorphobacter multimanifer]
MSALLCAPPAVPGLAARLLADTDCQAFGLVERGYAALAAPDGPASAALTGLLVIAVALFGYRLLLGRGVLSDSIGLMVRIGIVLAITTSWAAWQTLAYDTLARAPTRIASELLAGPAAVDPLIAVQVVLDRLESASIGFRTRAGIASPLVGGPAASSMTLTVSAFALTLSTVGLLVVARLVLAIMLALAPLMAGFLLFDATRGMAEGWLRAMVAAALVPLFVLTLVTIEIAILLPLIARLLAEQATGVYEATSVTPVGLVALVFAVAMVAGAAAGSRIAGGIRLPRRTDSPAQSVALVAASSTTSETVVAPAAQRPLAETLAAATRRESAATSAGTRPAMGGMMVAMARSTRGMSPSTAVVTMAAPAAGRPALSRAPRRTRAATRRDR